MAGGSVEGRHVDNRVGPFDQPIDSAPIRQVTFDEPRLRGSESIGHGLRPDQGRHLVPACPKGLEHPLPRVTGSPGESDLQAGSDGMTDLARKRMQSNGIAPRAGRRMHRQAWSICFLDLAGWRRLT